MVQPPLAWRFRSPEPRQPAKDDGNRCRSQPICGTDVDRLISCSELQRIDFQMPAQARRCLDRLKGWQPVGQETLQSAP